MVELGGWLSAAACQAIFWGSLRLSIRQVPRLERLFLTSPTNGLPLSPLFGLAPSHCRFSSGIGDHGDEEEVERLDCRLRQSISRPAEKSLMVLTQRSERDGCGGEPWFI